jgi:hypothetical protein
MYPIKMNRRDFLARSAMVGGYLVLSSPSLLADSRIVFSNINGDKYYSLFKNPDMYYHPFVRWWWNGNKVEAKELIRELHLLKEAGIGGVEINPIKFPSDTDDLGVKSLEWLSDEWIDMLKIAFDEAKKLGLTCDLIVGTGWPFGGEFLEGEERGQIVVIGVKKIKGPTRYETSLFNLLKEADPAISEPYSGRVPQLMGLTLVPEPLERMEQIIDLSTIYKEKDLFTVDIPEGDHVLYALVKLDAFAGVINGAPGANGPSLNHLNKAAVEKYLNHISTTIQKKIGLLSENIRSFFVDSLELEGANWCEDMVETFKKRNGYDMMPYLPYTMFKTEGMGNVSDYEYGAKMGEDFKNMINRMRYDVEITKAEMFRDRFGVTFVEWCRKLNVKSRAQLYGRGFFPLESSMLCDIPEGESWTTNWLQHRIGEEMSNEDYRRGRAYTMINKYVSSAGHLSGKRLISAEEMTNTYRVFNMTLEFLKIGCDQNAIAGITHSVFHGFNYSPAEAPFPGWIRYGAYYNEKNNWWSYFKHFNEYRARVSSMLQNADMYADIAILTPIADMWTNMGMQNEPFPSVINVPYQSLLWEAMHKMGNGTDYISEPIILDSTVKKGWLCYAKRKYNTLFLIEVESMQPATLAKLYDFVTSGGHVFCIEKYPSVSLGWSDHVQRDKEVKTQVEKLMFFPDRFVLLRKPVDNDFFAWYPAIQQKYQLSPFVSIEKPNPYVMVNRYIRDDQSDFFFFVNSHLHNSHHTIVKFPKIITVGKYAWIWDLIDGNRYRIELDKDGGFSLYLGPAESRVIVFDKEEQGERWNPLPVSGKNSRTLESWDVEFRHSCENTVEDTHMYVLEDLKDTQYVNFTGVVIYRKKVNISKLQNTILNLGKVWGIAEVKVNGEDCGMNWYGNRIYDISNKLKIGENDIEIYVITTMGNYIQTLTDNKIAQKWTNRPGRPQPKQSMGLVGPVVLYE